MKAKIRDRSVVALLAAVLVSQPICSYANAPEAIPQLGSATSGVTMANDEKTVDLGAAPSTASQSPWVASPDGQHLAYVKTDAGRSVVVFDGKAGPSLAIVADKRMVFSADSTRFAYSGRNDDMWRVYVDGKAGASYKAMGPIYISSNGMHVAYVAGHSNKMVVVLDEKPGTAYDGLGNGTPSMSQDGAQVAYYAKTGSVWFVVVDGRECGSFAASVNSPPVFSPDGTRVAYISNDDEKFALVVDDVTGPHYDAIGTRIDFSADSKKVAYVGMTDSIAHLIVDGSQSEGYDWVHPLGFSRGNNYASALVKKGQALHIVVGDWKSKAYEYIYEKTFHFGPHDGFSFTAQDGAEYFVVTATKTYGPYQAIGREFLAKQFQFNGIKEVQGFGDTFASADGRRLAYWARTRDEWMLFVDGVPVYTNIGTIEGSPTYSPLGRPVFSENGLHYACSVNTGSNYLMIVDGVVKQSLAYIDDESVTLSPDGTRIAFVTHIGEKDAVVLDGVIGQPYDAIGSAGIMGNVSVRFDDATGEPISNKRRPIRIYADGTASFLAKSGGRLLRVTRSK